jgi:hypothetical protein
MEYASALWYPAHESRVSVGRGDTAIRRILLVAVPAGTSRRFINPAEQPQTSFTSHFSIIQSAYSPHPVVAQHASIRNRVRMDSLRGIPLQHERLSPFDTVVISHEILPGAQGWGDRLIEASRAVTHWVADQSLLRVDRAVIHHRPAVPATWSTPSIERWWPRTQHLAATPPPDSQPVGVWS